MNNLQTLWKESIWPLNAQQLKSNRNLKNLNLTTSANLNNAFTLNSNQKCNKIFITKFNLRRFILNHFMLNRRHKNSNLKWGFKLQNLTCDLLMTKVAANWHLGHQVRNGVSTSKH